MKRAQVFGSENVLSLVNENVENVFKAVMTVNFSNDSFRFFKVINFCLIVCEFFTISIGV